MGRRSQDIAAEAGISMRTKMDGQRNLVCGSHTAHGSLSYSIFLYGIPQVQRRSALRSAIVC